MSAQSVARQYANVLFQVAERNQRVEPVGRDLADLVATVAGHAELRAVFETPLIVPRKKRALADALVQTSPALSPEVARLLTLLADRDRLMLLSDIAATYEARAMAARQEVAAEVITAMPMDEQSRTSLAEALGKVTGQTVNLSERVDPALVGGVVARVGSVVFDGSVARQVERLRERLLAEV